MTNIFPCPEMGKAHKKTLAQFWAWKISTPKCAKNAQTHAKISKNAKNCTKEGNKIFNRVKKKNCTAATIFFHLCPCCIIIKPSWSVGFWWINKAQGTEAQFFLMFLVFHYGNWKRPKKKSEVQKTSKNYHIIIPTFWTSHIRTNARKFC